MGKRFYSCSLDQPFLLSPSLQDWLPEGHLARFVADLMSTLDLRAIYADYERRDGRGHAAYHPEMMTRLLIYAYATGQPSSRQIEQATHDCLPYRYLAANQTPDHTVIAEFRRRHLPALADLFGQVLRLCDQMKLVKLGVLAVDGTKIKADASRRRSVPYQRISEREQYWQEMVAQLLTGAEQTDAREQAEAAAQPPVERALPERLAHAQTRLAEMRKAKQALEQEAQQKLAAAAADYEPLRGKQGRQAPPDRDPIEFKRAKRAYYRARKGVQKPTGQYNFVDPESRLMKDGATHAIVQAYNAQAAVDAHAQIIVAATITTDAADTEQLAPLVAAVEANLGRRPAVVVADKGYWNTKHVQALQTTPEGHTPIDVLVPPERDPEAGPTRSSPQNAVADAMRERLTSEPGRTLYRKRQGTVEPVFGVLKEQRGIRQFSFRGEQKNEAEWKIFCFTHNIRKLHRHRYPVPPPVKRKQKPNSASQRVAATEHGPNGPNSRCQPWWAACPWQFQRPAAA